jgi:hypothetical protein
MGRGKKPYEAGRRGRAEHKLDAIAHYLLKAFPAAVIVSWRRMK